jgi:hypothetical protein
MFHLQNRKKTRKNITNPLLQNMKVMRMFRPTATDNRSSHNAVNTDDLTMFDCAIVAA